MTISVIEPGSVDPRFNEIEISNLHHADMPKICPAVKKKPVKRVSNKAPKQGPVKRVSNKAPAQGPAKRVSNKSQNLLVMNNLIEFYQKDNNLENMLNIITSDADSRISLRIIDWFATNYAKKWYTLYNIKMKNGSVRRFKVYNEYKLKLKGYKKRRFDPFCRWNRIKYPYKDNSFIDTTIGQMNFFKWVMEHDIIDYISEHYDEIERDMNNRNSTAKRKTAAPAQGRGKTRKKREELSKSATSAIRKEEFIQTITFQ